MFYNQQLNESFIPNDVNDSSFLQEAYFGKNPLLLEIEKEFQKIIDATMSPKQFRLSKPVARIEELTTQLFNFKSTTVGISNIMSNAMAIGVDAFESTGLTKGEYGVRFKKPSRHAVIMVDINLNKASNLTASEMTAVYLHEVGHVMYTTSIYTKLFSVATFIAHLAYIVSSLPAATLAVAAGVADAVNNVIASATALILARTPIIGKIFEKLFRFTNEFVVDVSRDDTSMMVGLLQLIGKTYNGVKDWERIFKNTGKLNFDIGALIQLPYVYSHEKFADNFATAYGYGPELASGLSKMHNNPTDMFQDQMLDTTAGTVMLNVVNILALPMMVVGGLTEPHPSTHSRIKDQIAMTRFELKKSDMNPLLIADLEKDLAKLESTMERNTEAMLNLENNKNVLRNVMAAVCIKAVKTDSLRDSLLDLFRPRSIATHQIDIK